eukprot:1161652-Prorocentrum_lima.AAC.1
MTSVVRPGDQSRHTSLDMLSHPGARRRGRAANTVCTSWWSKGGGQEELAIEKPAESHSQTGGDAVP